MARRSHSIIILSQRCVSFPCWPSVCLEDDICVSIQLIDVCSFCQSKEEYEVSVCLCGSQVCRGSYLNLTGEGAFQKVLALMEFS